MHSHSKSNNSADKGKSKKSTEKIKKDNPFVYDPYTVEKQLKNKHNTLWVNLTGESQATRFLRVPYCLFTILAIDEATWLARLLDLENRHSIKGRLQKDGSFLCSQSFLNKSFCTTHKIQRRIIHTLKAKRYIVSKQARFGTRFLRINREILEKDLRAAQDLPIDGDGSTLVPKGSRLAKRNDHSKTLNSLPELLD